MKVYRGAVWGERPARRERERRVKAIALIDEWLADESGYDETTWPGLKQALQESMLCIGQ